MCPPGSQSWLPWVNKSFDDKNPVDGVALTLSGDDLGNLLPQDHFPMAGMRHGRCEGGQPVCS